MCCCILAKSVADIDDVNAIPDIPAVLTVERAILFNSIIEGENYSPY
jgi:hypothetical protein